jgi:hypothetical protein
LSKHGGAEFLSPGIPLSTTAFASACWSIPATVDRWHPDGISSRLALGPLPAELPGSLS